MNGSISKGPSPACSEGAGPKLMGPVTTEYAIAPAQYGQFAAPWPSCQEMHEAITILEPLTG